MRIQLLHKKLCPALLVAFLAIPNSLRAEWTPPFNMEGCVRRSRIVVHGTLDRQGELHPIQMISMHPSAADGLLLMSLKADPRGMVGWRKLDRERSLPMPLELDQYQFDLLKKLCGNDGPYEVVAFLDEKRGDKWRPALQYAGIVGFNGDGVFLAQDDLIKGELAKSTKFTQGSFLAFVGGECDAQIRFAGPGSQEYNVALIAAVQNHHYDLARLLIEKGATVVPRLTDLNARTAKGETALMAAAYGTGNTQESDDNASKFLAYLLTRGANPNAEDKYGITARMIADRAGFAEAVAMLEKAGARPFDLSDVKVKAAVVRVDAGFLSFYPATYDLWTGRRFQNGNKDARIDFGTLEKSMGRPGDPKSGWQSTAKVIFSGAIDICGHPYVMRPNHEKPVSIDARTIVELGDAVGQGFWDDYTLAD